MPEGNDGVVTSAASGVGGGAIGVASVALAVAAVAVSMAMLLGDRVPSAGAKAASAFTQTGR